MTESDQKLLDHFMNPRNVGVIENPDGFGRALNPVNQYLTDIYLRVKDGCIYDIKFKTFGCVVTIAAASALTTGVKGKSLSEIIDNNSSLKILFKLIETKLGVVPKRIGIAHRQRFKHSLLHFLITIRKCMMDNG